MKKVITVLLSCMMAFMSVNVFVYAEDDTEHFQFSDVTSKDQYYYDAVYWALDHGITQGTTPTTFSPNGNCKRYQFVLFLWRQAKCPEPGLTEDPFTDVKNDPNKDAYEKAVLWALDEGITTGTTDTTFEPYAPLTRGQVVTFLYRAAGSPKMTEEKWVVDQEAWDEPVYAGANICKACGWWSTGSALEMADHIYIEHGDAATYYRDRIQVDTIHHDEVGHYAEVVTTNNPFRDVGEGKYYYIPVLWAVKNKITTGVKPDQFQPTVTCTRGQTVLFMYRQFAE